MTSRQGSHWSQPLPNFSTTYSNGRDTNMAYDAAGHVKNYTSTSNDSYIHYNAAGQLFTQLEGGGAPGLPSIRENYYDGNGAKADYINFDGSLYNGAYQQSHITYMIRSSVLGGKVIAEFLNFTYMAESDPNKYYSKSYIYLKGVQLAFQEQAHRTTGDKHVVWTYHNPTVGSYFAEYQLNNSSGQQVNFPYGEMTSDPTGSYVGISEFQPIEVPSPFTFSSGQFMDWDGQCYADGVLTPCMVVQKMLNNGSGAYAPWDNTSTVWNPNASGGKGGYELAIFHVDWENGYYGFVPVGATYKKGSWFLPAGEDGENSVQGRLTPKIDELPITDVNNSFTFPTYKVMYKILEQFVNDQDCVAAFKAIGTDLVYRLTAEGQGIRLGPNNFFKNMPEFQRDAMKNLLGITDTGLDRALGMTKAGGGNAFTLGRAADLVEGALPSIFVSGNAVYVGKQHLAYTLAHELIHAFGWEGRGGVDSRKGKFYPRGATPHDLDHMGNLHDDILEACVKGKGFKDN